MRDYSRIDKYLDELSVDIYPQQSDPGHTKMAETTISTWHKYIKEHKTVLDLGCGQGFCRHLFPDQHWTGITLGEDYNVCMLAGLNVLKQDISFLDLPDGSFDLLFARHILEHSPMPLLTLMEWYRVSKNALLLIAPNPTHFLYYGINHYAVMQAESILWLASRAGWKCIESRNTIQELQFYFIKDKPRYLAPHYKVEYDEQENFINAE